MSRRRLDSRRRLGGVTLPIIVVPPVSDMTDENFINHLEARHADALRMRWVGRVGKRMFNRTTWEIYHAWLHKHSGFEHEHREIT